ncbi:hypothetical protein Xszus_03671 [Xenorhabdus szentirmaii]|nr:hypothetical protein Xsze_01518 [Xenorhabdus szentirmaii DSM 16338]PHM43860.1 hypothetical protein Xszus_03671 [Xenorhabdus szentirmaii]
MYQGTLLVRIFIVHDCLVSSNILFLEIGLRYFPGNRSAIAYKLFKYYYFFTVILSFLAQHKWDKGI